MATAGRGRDVELTSKEMNVCNVTYSNTVGEDSIHIRKLVLLRSLRMIRNR